MIFNIITAQKERYLRVSVALHFEKKFPPQLRHWAHCNLANGMFIVWVVYVVISWAKLAKSLRSIGRCSTILTILGFAAENWKEVTASPVLVQGDDASIALDPIIKSNNESNQDFFFLYKKKFLIWEKSVPSLHRTKNNAPNSASPACK